MGIETKRRLLGPVGVGDQAGGAMNAEIVGTAGTRALDLAFMLELINNGVDERPLAEEQVVC